MTESQSFETVTIQHSCGHFVTYEIPYPRRVYHRSNAQAAQYYCESCKAMPKSARPTTAVYEVIDEDSYQIAFVQGSYPIKDILAERGYDFIPRYFRTNRGANVLNCDQERAIAELAWIRDNGWKVDAVQAHQMAPAMA